MAPPVRVDTDVMQATGRQGEDSAQNMLGHARTLRTGLEFVRNKWQGQAGNAFRAATQGQEKMLDQLIVKLQDISSKITKGGQGFDTQDAGAGTNLNAKGQQFLTAPLNQ